jgi:CRP-like cAMP-binding protein
MSVEDEEREAEAALASVPLFEGIPTKTLHALAQLGKFLDFAEGHEVVKEGHTDGRLYVILDGRAEAVAGGRHLHEFGPGDYFGELALLDDQPRSATVRALTPLRTFSLMRVHARPVLQDPVVLERLLLNVSRWLREGRSTPLP